MLHKRNYGYLGVEGKAGLVSMLQRSLDNAGEVKNIGFFACRRDLDFWDCFESFSSKTIPIIL